MLAVYAAVDDTVSIRQRDIGGDEDRALDLVGIVNFLGLRGLLGRYVGKAACLEGLRQGAFSLAVLLGGGGGTQSPLLSGEDWRDWLVPS